MGIKNSKSFCNFATMNNNQKVLSEIQKQAVIGQRVSFSFNKLSAELSMSKRELDEALNELEKGHFITQFILEENDNFIIILK